MQTLVVLLLLGLANARLSDDKCNEYNKKALSNGPSLINEFPHMGLLGHTYHDTTMYSCPATLIDVSVAITPAFCITSSLGPPKSALFGTLNSDEKGDNYKLVNVVETIVHPQFVHQATSKVHSIALVKFSPPITPNDYIRPGCLYSRNVEDDQIVVDLLWETPSEGSNLFKVNSSIVSTSSCQKKYEEYIKRGSTIDAQSHLCMIRNYDGPYRPHIGGTSHVYEDGLPKIGAIDNFGILQGSVTLPDVSTKISTYLDWIEQNAWGKEKVE